MCLVLLELELQTVESDHVGNLTGAWSSAEQQVLLTASGVFCPLSYSLVLMEGYLAPCLGSAEFGAIAGGRAFGAQLRACSPVTPPAPGPFGVRADPGSSSREMKEGSLALAASPELPPPPPPLQCTFKWKIFRSQQKHCVQKRLSRTYHQTRE